MNRRSTMARTRQQGMALIVALSGNLYDRSLSMQATEAALRAAEEAIELANGNVGILCAPGTGQICPSIPVNTFDGNASWTNVLPPFVVNQGLSSGTAQYHIAFIGAGNADDPGLIERNQDWCANNPQSCPPPSALFFRITARSHDPTIAGLEHRSLVVLQAIMRLAN
jgi:type IV pilus assembly protein PilX